MLDFPSRNANVDEMSQALKKFRTLLENKEFSFDRAIVVKFLNQGLKFSVFCWSPLLLSCATRDCDAVSHRSVRPGSVSYFFLPSNSR